MNSWSTMEILPVTLRCRFCLRLCERSLHRLLKSPWSLRDLEKNHHSLRLALSFTVSTFTESSQNKLDPSPRVSTRTYDHPATGITPPIGPIGPISLGPDVEHCKQVDLDPALVGGVKARTLGS